MATPRLPCLALLLLASFMITLDLSSAAADYPDVIELVGYSNRRARTHYIPVAFKGRGRHVDSATNAPPPAKMQADIETVKQNIEKYNKLLTLDTKNLPESQKDMLERIVERVARLKESLDVEQTTMQANRTGEPVTELTTEAYSDSFGMEAETDPTLMLDETTLLQLQTSMDELAVAQEATATAESMPMRELPAVTSSTEESTDATAVDSRSEVVPSVEYESTTDTPSLTHVTEDLSDDQFVAARSNNRNIAAITAAESVPSPAASSTPLTTNILGNQRTLTTSGKMQKTRATKRPLMGSPSKVTSGAGTTSKRVSGGQRPGSSTTALHKPTTAKQKLAAAAAAAATTARPHQKVKVHQQQQKRVTDKFTVTPATPNDQIIHPRVPQSGTAHVGTLVAPAATAATAAPLPSVTSYGAGSEMMYDAHVNTSAIIDSLNQAREEFYQQKNNGGGNKDKKPSATAKPTKYHYYPHNQHIYLLPECAIQQVCNAVYVRLNYTQPLCACPSRYRDPCSASLNEDDQHTTKLVGDGKKKAITLAKTCEDTKEMRECRSPKDWSLLALQNTRTGKSHYLVICRCPDHFKMEGPMAHDQPTYASVPGIRVFGMMCVKPGVTVRKPSAQPPKRYQLQKPFYRPSSFSSNNQYNSNKDMYGRPAPASFNDHGSGYHHQNQNTYSGQHHSTNYQYLNRPEHLHSGMTSNNYHHPEMSGGFNGGGGSSSSLGGGSIYGRNNERKGQMPIQAAAATEADEDVAKTEVMATSTPAFSGEARTTNHGDGVSGVRVQSESETATETTAAAASAPPVTMTDSLIQENKREKRSLAEKVSVLEDNDQMPEFPWDRVIEFQRSIVWD